MQLDLVTSMTDRAPTTLQVNPVTPITWHTPRVAESATKIFRINRSLTWIISLCLDDMALQFTNWSNAFVITGWQWTLLMNVVVSCIVLMSKVVRVICITSWGSFIMRSFRMSPTGRFGGKVAFLLCTVSVEAPPFYYLWVLDSRNCFLVIRLPGSSACKLGLPKASNGLKGLAAAAASEWIWRCK